MPLEDEQLPYSYIAYIDEAGDDGIRKVRPIDPNGASEWLVLSAIVIRASREKELIDCLRDYKNQDQPSTVSQYTFSTAKG